jgi:hypothetical protein
MVWVGVSLVIKIVVYFEGLGFGLG